MEFIRCAESTAVNCIQSSTLVLPALSIGNVGQLAVDLLISSLDAKRIGYLEDPNILPCVGNDPFGPKPEGQLTLALELYADIARGLSILQQRSPVAKGNMLMYAKNLATWTKNAGFKEIVILSGLDSGPRRYEMTDSQIQYISNADEDGTNGRCKLLGWKKFNDLEKLEQVWHSLATESILNADEDDMSIDDNTISRLPVVSLFCCLKEEGLKVLGLLHYCSEGDNIPDSIIMVNALDKLFQLFNPKEKGQECTQWKIPLSWATVYGPPPDQSMFY